MATIRSKRARTRIRSYVAAVAPSIDTCSHSSPLVTHRCARGAVRSVRLVFVLTRIPLPAAYPTMSKKRGCMKGSPSPWRCSSSRPGKPSTRRVKLSNGMNASGPWGGPSVRNWMGHMRQRRLHCPTGSTCR